jgi:hypothetical protein
MTETRNQADIIINLNDLGSVFVVQFSGTATNEDANFLQE